MWTTLLWIFCVFTHLAQSHPGDSIYSPPKLLDFIRGFIPSQCHPEIYSHALYSMVPKFTWSFFSVPNSSSFFLPDSLTMINPPYLSFLHAYKLTHIQKDIPKIHTHLSMHTPMYAPAYTCNLRCSIYLRNIFSHIPFFLTEDKKHARVKCCHSVYNYGLNIRDYLTSLTPQKRCELRGMEARIS